MGKDTIPPTYKELQQRVALLETLLKDIGCPIIVADANGVVRMLNTAAAAYVDGTPASFAGKSIRELIPEKADIYLERIRRILRRQVTEGFEDEIDLPSGKKWFSSIWQTVKDENGDRERVVTVAWDITHKKQIEADLRLTEGHLRSMMESAANFAVYRLVHDEKHPNKLRVLFVSPSIKEILGIPEPMKFETWFAHIHPEDVERMTQANREAFETHRFNEQYRTYHPEAGEWRWIHAVSTGGADPTDINHYINGIMIDITERKVIEETLKRYERQLEKRTRNLEEANTALKVIVEQRKRDAIELEEKVSSNIEIAILPFIKKMRKEKLNADLKDYLNIIDSNLKSITSSFSAKLSSRHIGLTHTEIQVANFVKLGYTTKQTSERMGVSPKTVDVHRLKIRKKLGIVGQKTNLRTYLLSHLDS